MTEMAGWVSPKYAPVLEIYNLGQFLILGCFPHHFLVIHHNVYSGRYPFTNSGDIRSLRW